MHDNIFHHGFDVTAPLSYTQPPEPRTGPKTDELLIAGRDIFCLGRDDYEIDFELSLFVHLDDGCVARLGNAKQHFVHLFRPVVEGLEMFINIDVQGKLFEMCIETKQGKEHLLELCRTKNDE